MQDMLVPIFGEDGAIIVQYVVTLAVVLGLIVLVVWGIRRYTGGSVRPAARGRLPRLAVVDTLDIDKKRQLVLIRRDGVEHLLLIGGPSDVVVEPSIIRQRVTPRPGQSTAMPAAPTGPTPDAAAAASHGPPPPAPSLKAVPPAPPPPARPTPAQRVMPTRGQASDFAAAGRRREQPSYPPRRSVIRGGAAAVAPAIEATAAEPIPEPDPAPPPRRTIEPATDYESPPDGPVPGYATTVEDDQDSVSAFAPPPADEPELVNSEAPVEDVAPTEAAFPTVSPEPQEPPEPAAQAAEVSDLEKEMARLLDEISTTRRE